MSIETALIEAFWSAVSPSKNACKLAELRSRSLPLAGALFSEQGGERAAGVVGGEQVAEVGEQRPVLQAASDRGRQGALGESFVIIGLVAVGQFSVDDRSAERSFGRVVGRGDAGDGDERPERRPELEQVVREAAVQPVACAAVGGMLEQLA